MSVRSQDPVTAGMIEASEPTDLQGRVLTLSFPDSAGFQKSMCDKNAEKIEKLLSGIITSGIKPRFELGGVQARKSAKPIVNNRIPDKKKAEVRNDPVVKTLLMGLDATVLDIREINRDLQSPD